MLLVQKHHNILQKISVKCGIFVVLLSSFVIGARRLVYVTQCV